MDGKIPCTAPASKEHWCQIQLLQKETSFFPKVSESIKKAAQIPSTHAAVNVSPTRAFWQPRCNFTLSSPLMVQSFICWKNSSNGSTGCYVFNIHLHRPDWGESHRRPRTYGRFRHREVSSFYISKHVEFPNVTRQFQIAVTTASVNYPCLLQRNRVFLKFPFCSLLF